MNPSDYRFTIPCLGFGSDLGVLILRTSHPRTQKPKPRQENPRVIPLVNPHPVIVTIRDNGDYIGSAYIPIYTTITGWGGSP